MHDRIIALHPAETHKESVSGAIRTLNSPSAYIHGMPTLSAGGYTEIPKPALIPAPCLCSGRSAHHGIRRRRQ